MHPGPFLPKPSLVLSIAWGILAASGQMSIGIPFAAWCDHGFCISNALVSDTWMHSHEQVCLDWRCTRLSSDWEMPQQSCPLFQAVFPVGCGTQHHSWQQTMCSIHNERQWIMKGVLLELYAHGEINGESVWYTWACHELWVSAWGPLNDYR